MKFFKLISLFILIFTLSACSGDTNSSRDNNSSMPNNEQQEKNLLTEYNGAILKTNRGDIEVKFYNQDAPKTVKNFLKLSQEGFYDNTRFHRVIEDFMIQGGDPLSKELDKKNMWGMGGPGYKFEDEINSHKLVKGSLAMANSGLDTNGSQFFIVTTEETPWLDGKHTNFGEVVSGMDVVEEIENTDTDPNSRPIEDVVLEEIELVEK